jgi:hypothetical protein
VRGKCRPLPSTVELVVKALESQLNKPLDHHEVVFRDGSYPTHSNRLPGLPADRSYTADGEILEEMPAKAGAPNAG